MTDLPNRKHLQRLDHVWVRPAIYYITTNTLRRQRVLVPRLADTVTGALVEAAEKSGWAVGRYVVMLGHIHFFCQEERPAKPLSAFVGAFKQRATRLAWEDGWRGGLWQPEFFDHVLRSDESYEQKWVYVRMNPVRAGLCASVEDWPYQGEVTVLTMH